MRRRSATTSPPPTPHARAAGSSPCAACPSRTTTWLSCRPPSVRRCVVPRAHWPPPLTSWPRRPAAMLDLLAYLRLERNPRLTLRGVGSAGGLSALESLTLSDTGVDAVPAEAPRRLLTFAQRRCGLVAVLPDVFTRWERIRDLDLRYGRGAGVRATHGTPLSRILPPAASTSCSRSPPRSATSPAYARCTSGTTSCRSCRTSCASAGR